VRWGEIADIKLRAGDNLPTHHAELSLASTTVLIRGGKSTAAAAAAEK